MVDMIKFIKTQFKFICDNSSMHGAKYLMREDLMIGERIFWFIAMFIAGNSVFYVTSFLINRHLENPLFIAVERDHMNWDVVFPPITLCAHEKMNETALDEFLTQNNFPNANNTEQFLRKLINLNMETFETDWEQDVGILPEEYLEIIYQLTNRFENNAHADSNELYPLRATITELGLCFTYNSLILDHISAENILGKNPLAAQDVYRVTYAQGLTEAALMEINETSHNDIYYHGPFDIPGLGKIAIPTDTNSYTQLKISSINIYSSNKVRNLFISQRKCRFFDESHLKRSPNFYSKSFCLRECQIEKMLKLCGCLPPFYRLEKGETYCDSRGLECIGYYIEQIKDPHGCNCLIGCESSRYILDQVQHVMWFRGNGLRWEFINSKTRFRRDVLNGLRDVVIFFGASSGALLGISVLSFIEFFYFYFMKIQASFYKFKHCNPN